MKSETEIRAAQSVEGSTSVVDVRPLYPVNPVELPTFWGNLVAVTRLQDEIYLDICQVQPQTLKKDGTPAAAMVVARVVFSVGHAMKLVTILSENLKAGDVAPTK